VTIEDINIKYCDLLLSKYQFNGMFYHADLLLEKNVKLTDAEKKVYSDAGFEWFPTLTGFMINNGYLFDNGELSGLIEDKYYKLTERGNLAKELGGHKRFQKHRRDEINLIRNQKYINIGLLAVTFIVAIITSIINKPTNVINLPQQQNPAVSIYVDSVLRWKKLPDNGHPKQLNQQVRPSR
jgi:hypothetical protein